MVDVYRLRKQQERSRRNEAEYARLEQAQMASKELAAAMEPTAKQAAEWAADYKRYQNPRSYVLDDGEQVSPKEAADELKALNTALRRYIEVNGEVSVEGVGTLILQPASSDKVDLLSLYERSPETVMRLLKLGCLTVDMKILEANEKNGMVAEFIPRMPVAQTPRLVWAKK